MALLNPFPFTLGLASPALGPWFKAATTPADLPLPIADLSVPLSLPAGMQWCAPAGCTSAYFVVTTPRPSGLAHLRRADGELAFNENALVVLVTLLPEVELRLSALTNVIVRPTGALPPAGQPGRPAVRHLAIEVPAGASASIAAIESLRPTPFPVDLTTDAAKAAYLGLAIDGGTIRNSKSPIAELHRPTYPSEVVLQNNTTATLETKLWAFDDRGRALDPGAVATWWSHMASGDPINAGDPLFGNLWADNLNTVFRRTATVTNGMTVLFCSANEGPLPQALLNRLNLAASFTLVSGALYSVAPAPAPTVAVTGPPATGADLLPVPRLALLPNGPYLTLITGAPAGFFNGWANPAAWPTTLGRDFARVAVLDVESHLIGVDRTDPIQGNNRLRTNVFRNTALNPVLVTADAAANQVLTTLGAGAAVAMAPTMDVDWGALAPGGFGPDTTGISLNFTVHALAGEGTEDGDTVADQKIVLHFGLGSLPRGGWIRVWPHGLDTTTGRRFRQDGGAALADNFGEAFVVVDLPDGARNVRMSFDALVVTGVDARYYVEQRFDRPAPVSGNRIALPPLPNLPPDIIPWMCEQGAPLQRGAGLLGGGVTLLGVPDDEDDGTYALVDLSTLAPTDVVASALRNATTGADQLIVTEPAFVDSSEGDIRDPTAVPPAPIAAAVLWRGRTGVIPVIAMGQPVPTMERREVFAVDPTANVQTGIVAGISGRARHHEAIPAQLGHAGMPGAAEIHGTGVALAGPIASALTMLMRERSVATINAFVPLAGVPNVPAPGGGGPTPMAAVLETITFGVAGDQTARALAAAGWTPGQLWVNIKNSIEAQLGGVNLDPVIDTANFQDDLAATAVDALIAKTGTGAAQGAVALQAAIARAEDFIYVETPAIDALTAGSGSGAVDLVGALKARLRQRPGLAIMLCVPERFLPEQPARLEIIRQDGINDALKQLVDAAPHNVQLFTPTAGSGRPLHMASTTVVVDDVFLLSGTTHLWRRGLTFDSSMAVALFDEALTLGRPTVVRAARRQLLADRLGMAVALVPDDPAHMVDAIRRLNGAGGLQRVAVGVYSATAARTSPADFVIWNPDGRPGGTTDWFVFFGDLFADASSGLNNAIR